MTIEQAKCKVLDLARSEIGIHEVGDNGVPFNQGTWDDELYGWNTENQPWCDIWVDHLFVENFGLETGAAMTYQFKGCCGAACGASADYYRQNGAYYDYPQIGDQIFFYSGGCIGHTGIVESVNGSTVVTIEGNYSDSVCRNNYPIGNSNIAGYGRPNWRLAEDIPVDGAATETAETETDEIPKPDIPEDEATTVPIYTPTPTVAVEEKGVHVCRPSEYSYFVFAMQYLLKENEYWVQADGYYALDTAKWLLKFQGDHPPLAQDALCGEETWNALFKDKTLIITDRGCAVRAMQYLLKAQDYFIYEDGIFGSQAYTQLVKFQQSRNLQPTGVCDKDTWNELIRV